MSMVGLVNLLASLVFVTIILFLPYLSSVCNSLPARAHSSKPWNKVLRDIVSGHTFNRTRRDISRPGIVVRYTSPEHKLYMKILYPQNAKGSADFFKKTPAYVKRGRMYCKTGYLLSINMDGTVDGTTDHTSQYANLEFHSIGTGLLMIQGVKTSRYLTLTDKGKLIGNSEPSLNSVFVETHEKNQYTTYTSYKSRHLNWLVAIKKNGKVKRAQITGIGQRSTQFLVRFSQT